MKVFIWDYVEKCSNNYHSGGGVVVFAETEARARELANAADYDGNPTDGSAGCRIAATEMPDEVRDVSGGLEKVYLMPDAGCC